MKHINLLFIFSIILCGCFGDKYFDGPDYFQDDFEGYYTYEEMLLPDDILWSFTQITNPENIITIDSTNMHAGKKCLQFAAIKSSDNLVSKCSIAKQNMAYWEGETIQVSAWYFIEGIQTAEWLFLLDMEEQTAIGAGPGMRLALVNNQLRVEYKFNEKDIVQPEGQEVDFPRNEWVELIWQVKLSQKQEGFVKLWQNGNLIIDSKNNTTLPSDILYFQQGTKGMYSSIEIGITANSKDNDLTLRVDDIEFEKVN